MKHQIQKYIDNRLLDKNWSSKQLSELSGISAGQISKLKSGQISKLTADVFYRIYTAFGDPCQFAAKKVYPNLDLRKVLKPYTPRPRNAFGQFMEKYEASKNSIEEIAAETGINENRLKDLYFRRASLEAYELLLIERAVDKNPGELFEELFGPLAETP